MTLPRGIPARGWAVLAPLTILLATSCGGTDGGTSGAAAPAPTPASARSLPAPPTDDDRRTATDGRDADFTATIQAIDGNN